MADEISHHVGGTARLEPAAADPIAGEIVTQTFDYDSGRQVSVYRPPARPEAVIFCGDGQLLSRWGGYLEAADLPPTMIIGAHRTGSADEMARIGEYLPGIDAIRFAAHESFFVRDIRAWLQARLGVALSANRTAVAGVSAGAELALALGLRHPDIYGTVFAASPGAGYRPPPTMPTALPRTYLTAGTLEPFFLDNARRWAEALQQAGGDVINTEPAGDHGGPFWQVEFVKMVAWIYAQ